MKPALIILLSCAVIGGCKKTPIERAHDATAGGALGRFGAAPAFVIFNSELASGGGAFEYPGGENQTLTFLETQNTISGRSIRYHWTGQPAAAGSTNHSFAGFDLMHTAQQADYTATPARDLSAAGYTSARFYARGSLSTNTVLKIEVADDGNTATAAPCVVLSTNGTDTGGTSCTPGFLTSDWRQYSIPLTSTALSAVKDFFKATFIFTDPFVGNQAPGQGGTVYLDEVLYLP
jgi:hypothetical protein